VTVGKRTTQEQQRVEEETRKEEIKVEKGGREGTRPHSR
jgi:stress response protein YsnF